MTARLRSVLLDTPLFALDTPISLSLGYAPDPLPQLFDGEIVGQTVTFPSGGAPTLTVVGQDRRQHLQRGTKVRWFGVPVTCLGDFPIPDPAVASLVAAEHRLVPMFEPIGSALAVLIGGVQIAVGLGNAQVMQKIIRKQAGETDLDFLKRIAAENGWEVVMDHQGPLGGRQLRFMSPLDHLTPDVVLRYGQSLLDFSPRVSNVGQIAGVSAAIWSQDIKMEFQVSVSWDWDRSALTLSIVPGFGRPAAGSTGPQTTILDEAISLQEPLSVVTAPRMILRKLIPRLNSRLTGSGSTVGDPRIVAGTVLRIEGVGERFGGLYRVTSATHTLDASGYRTAFDVRKEIWFGSIPLYEQGAIRVQVQ